MKGSPKTPEPAQGAHPVRREYAPPAIVFEKVTEALAATCSGNACPSKDSAGTCNDGGLMTACQALKS